MDAGLQSVAAADDLTGAYRGLVESVRVGHCILFLGAGVHYPPPEGSRFKYTAEEQPPLGSTLARQLAEDCNFPAICPGEDPGNLQRVSLCYEKELGRAALVRRVRDTVEERSQPSAAVRALAQLPFTLVITTNYDTLYERALRGGEVRKNPFVTEFDPNSELPTRDYPQGADPTAERPFVFKMHGDVNVAESIVVTDEDYIGFILRMKESDRFHPVPETFRYHFVRWPTLFVGYSLLDYNLRLLFRTLRWKLDAAQYPQTYSVDVHPDPLIQDVWQREQGFRFIAQDVWDFVPRLYHNVLGREMSA